MMRTALALREKGRVHIDGHYNKCTYNYTQHICLHSYPMFWQLYFDESQLPPAYKYIITFQFTHTPERSDKI